MDKILPRRGGRGQAENGPGGNSFRRQKRYPLRASAARLLRFAPRVRRRQMGPLPYEWTVTATLTTHPPDGGAHTLRSTTNIHAPNLLSFCLRGRVKSCATHKLCRRLPAALVHESERYRRIFRFGNLIQAPIAKDSGRPSSIIRFRILQAINASASCDLG